MSKRKRTVKRKQTYRRKTGYNSNQPYKLMEMGIKSATGIAALGITATALTNIAKP